MARLGPMAAFRLALRASLAAALASFVAESLRLPFPVYAMISAVVVTDFSATETRKLGIPRLGGTFVGALIGALVSLALPAGAWEAGLGILCAMMAANLCGLQHAAKVAGYVSGIVIYNFDDQAWHHATYRIVETALGIAAAMLVSYVPQLLPGDSSAETK